MKKQQPERSVRRFGKRHQIRRSPKKDRSILGFPSWVVTGLGKPGENRQVRYFDKMQLRERESDCGRDC